nr:hypothetical protein [Oceanithermus profundus]
MPMLAPRRLPPWRISSVARSKTRRNESGPEARPPVRVTRSPSGRTAEKLKPVPPPDWCTRAVSCRVWKIASTASSIGSTKQAESWPSGVPAFISVGELGRKSSPAMAASKRSAQASASLRLP